MEHPSSRTLAFHALLPGLLFAGLCAALFAVPLPWAFSVPWVPSLGIALSFRVDALAAQYLLLITGIGTLVFFYGAGYLAGDGRAHRVFILLHAFMLAMIGAASADHLLVLFLFWELTSVLSFMLVGFDHAREASREAAKQALMITGLGGLALLAGMILLAGAGDSTSLHTLVQTAPAWMDDPRVYPALGLIILGACTKSAQVPFHFWLPNAMAAPTPVSAYLHSATMVKLGIYLLARLDAGFSDELAWENTLVGIGTVTAVFAAIQTMRERDLKRILAWSTVATLGTLVMLIGLPGGGAALAVSALFFAHALYKAPLFFVAGNLDHGAGTRLIDRLTGMRRHMPWTAAAALLAAVSMAGLPLTFGFIAKDALTIAKVEAGVLLAVSYATVFVGSVSAAVAGIAAIRVFWGRDTVPRNAHPHEVGWLMRLPPLLLVATGLAFGLAPELVDPLLGTATQAIAPAFIPATVDQSWEVGPVLRAVLATLAGGVLVYFGWDRLHALIGRAGALDHIGPESWYWRQLRAIPRWAGALTRRLQHGHLPRYLATFILAALAVVLALLAVSTPRGAMPSPAGVGWPVASAVTLTGGAALTVFFVRDRLVLLLLGGVIAFGCALVFLWTGAPDLAWTQFAVEVVLVVVAAAVLGRIAAHRGAGDTPRPLLPTAVRAGLALAFGATMAVLLLIATASPVDPALPAFFGAQSLVAAGGRNVVNVILVDFRALDTLGEIAVVACALLAALPLVARHRKRPGGPR